MPISFFQRRFKDTADAHIHHHTAVVHIRDILHPGGDGVTGLGILGQDMGPGVGHHSVLLCEGAGDRRTEGIVREAGRRSRHHNARWVVVVYRMPDPSHICWQALVFHMLGLGHIHHGRVVQVNVADHRRRGHCRSS